MIVHKGNGKEFDGAGIIDARPYASDFWGRSEPDPASRSCGHDSCDHSPGRHGSAPSLLLRPLGHNCSPVT